MKSILLIGLGKFGQLLGDSLVSRGNEVMIADKDEAIVNELAPKYSNAVITNCMNIDNLRRFDIPHFDACVVAISDDFESSLAITSNLKDLGAKYVIAKSSSELQSTFLKKIGADEVVYPNKDSSEKLALKLDSFKTYEGYNITEVDPNYSISEMDVPPSWVGRKLQDINPRNAHRLNVLIIRTSQNNIPTPNGNYVFKEGDRMVVFGDNNKIAAFVNSKNK